MADKNTNKLLKIAELIKKRWLIAVIILAFAAAACAGILYFNKAGRMKAEKAQAGPEIIVNDKTELIYCDDIDGYVDAYNNLKREYDDEDVRSGKKPPARVLVGFKGNSIDISSYGADKVIAMKLLKEQNGITIQFASPEEAQKCMEELNNRGDDIAAGLDEIQTLNTPENTAEASGTAGYGGYRKYCSDYTDYDYYSWGVTDMGMDKLAASLMKNPSGKEVIVAVIDTGVDANREIEDRLFPGKNFADSGSSDGLNPSNGHGTHVAGVILNATQGLNVKVMPLRVFGDDEYAYTGAILAALEYACDKGADVINMSLGGPKNRIEDNAVREVIKQGVTVVVAAGNESEDTKYCTPANVEECITVGAYGSRRRIADFSNYGAAVDTAAPGVDVLSYWCDDERAGYFMNGINVELLDGTSMAAPHVAALAAMVKLAVPDAAPAQVEKYIKDYCDGNGDRKHFGSGICQAGLLGD